MSKSGSKIREQVAHFLVDIHIEMINQVFQPQQLLPST